MQWRQECCQTKYISSSDIFMQITVPLTKLFNGLKQKETVAFSTNIFLAKPCF